MEDSAVWILESNLEFSEELAIRKLEEFQNEIAAVKKRLQDYPESGETDEIKSVRKFPIYIKSKKASAGKTAKAPVLCGGFVPNLTILRG